MREGGQALKGREARLKRVKAPATEQGANMTHAAPAITCKPISASAYL